MIKLPIEYETAARERKIIPFIGAGFSKNISGDMPNWGEVMTVVAEVLGFEPDVLDAQGDYLQIAEYLKIRNKHGDVYADLSARFHQKTMSVSASRPHQLLPYVDSSAIFTTNWDFWVERAFEYEGIPYVKIVSPRDFYEREVKAASPSRAPLFDGTKRAKIRKEYKATTVVKFHGDFTDHNSIVFTEGKYFDRMAFEDPLDVYLRSEILGRSVLFIGYSFSDRNIRFIWHRLNRMMQDVPQYARRPSFIATSSGSPVQREILRQMGIGMISLSPDDVSGGIAEILERTIELQGV